MKQIIAITNSNAVNRYGMVFPVQVLESALNQTWDKGTPSLMSHDCHRPIGWHKGLSLYFEPDLVCSTGLFLMPENDQEYDNIITSTKNYISNKHVDFAEPHRQELNDKLKPYLSGGELLCAPSCAAFKDRGLVRKVFPGIIKQQDKDGLIPISLLTPKAPGVFEKDGLLFFAHPFFRRSLSGLNNINEPFFDILQTLTSSDLDIRIALDENMIGLSSTFQQTFELEYWWGPKFNDDLKSIPDGINRHEADDKERLFHGISATEFWWFSRKGEKTFECEELRDIPSCGISSNDFGCRYVHSILNSSKDGSTHLDGAIRLYEEKVMINRLDSNIRDFGRNSSYTKLWRIEGDLQVSAWKEIITHYFRDNHLIGEYFGAVEEPSLEEVSIDSNVEKGSSMHEYIPYDMKAGEGIRISISYHHKTENSKSNIFIKSFDSITHGSTEYNYIEADTTEIIKYLRRHSLNLKVPADISYVAFKDLVINFPLILHTGPHACEHATMTQNAISELCDIWNERGDDRLVSYNIGIQYSDRDVYFSFAGHVHDLNIWFQNNTIDFPTDISQLPDWCEAVDTKISKQHSPSMNQSLLGSMLHKTGLLLFERSFLMPEEYEIQIDDKNQVLTKLVIPKEKPELYQFLNSGSLGVAPVLLIKDSKCSSCNECYRLCDCSKYLQKDVSQIISKMEPLGLFWTNRKA